MFTSLGIPDVDGILLVGTYVKGITITIMKGGETGVVFWSKVYLSI